METKSKHNKLYSKLFGIELPSDYKAFPSERNLYNLNLVRGNVNLAAGRFKTKKEADELVKEFLNQKMP